jgi:hypothetical protein
MIRDSRQRAETVPLPVVDPAMFRGVLGEITRAIEPGTEADTAGVYGSLLAMTGAVIGPGPHMMIGDSYHPLLIWPQLIGPTNAGRKGDATASARRVVETAFPDLRSISATGLSSGEGIIARLQDPDEKTGKGTHDKRLIITEPEWARVMSVCRREGSTMSGVLRAAWDGSPLEVIIKESYGSAEASHVAVITHITPVELRLKLNQADIAGGLHNRFLPLYVERRKLLALPPGLSPEKLKFLSRKLARAIANARKLHELTLGESAEEYWKDEVYPDLTAVAEGNTIEAAYIQRAPAYCRRISALLSALDGSDRTTLADLESAVALMGYSASSARYALSTAERNPDFDKLKRAVDESRVRGLTRTQVSNLFSRHLSGVRLSELINELRSDPAYETTKMSTDGAPRTIIRLVSSSLSSEIGELAK